MYEKILLGKLSKVKDLRKVWQDEARNFILLCNEMK